MLQCHFIRWHYLPTVPYACRFSEVRLRKDKHQLTDDQRSTMDRKSIQRLSKRPVHLTLIDKEEISGVDMR